jgi:hypothetical protein
MVHLPAPAVSLPPRHHSRPPAAVEVESPVNDTLSTAQLALSAVPGVALVLTLKLLIDGYRRAAARPAQPTWNSHDAYL